MAFRSSSNGQGNSFVLETVVPAGAAIDDIAILVGSIDNFVGGFTGRWPTGFTQFFDTDCTADGQEVGLAWKRLTSADTGSYTLSALADTGYWICQCALFSGRHTTTAPTATEAIQNTGQSSPVSVNATGFTASDGDDALWVGAPDVTVTQIGNGMASPTNYTERQDAEEIWTNLSIASRDNLSAGSTGTVTGTFSLTSNTAGWVAYLVQLPAAAGAAPPPGRTLMTMGIGR